MDESTAPSTIPHQALRAALGRFTTGVTIITCVDAAGANVGLTASSFGALSLDPPLVLWSLRKESPSLAAFQGAPHFAVNVLAENQVDLSRRFASPTPDKFGQGTWSAGIGDVRVLDGGVAVFECERFAQHDAGDHVLFIGLVLRAREFAVAPLVHQSGRYHGLGEIL